MKLYVGEYNEADLKVGKDKADIEKLKKETGLNYVKTTPVKNKAGVYVSLKIWLYDYEGYCMTA